jgi:hypothetical protein
MEHSSGVGGKKHSQELLIAWSKRNFVPNAWNLPQHSTDGPASYFMHMNA